MHDIIGMLSVLADIGFKIKYRISVSIAISTNIITNKITGCCFFGKMPESRHISYVPCGQTMFIYFVICETGQICPGCVYCSDFLRESIIQF